eukprot:3441859-Prymnesium_polylepis.1
MLCSSAGCHAGCQCQNENTPPWTTRQQCCIRRSSRCIQEGSRACLLPPALPAEEWQTTLAQTAQGST